MILRNRKTLILVPIYILYIFAIVILITATTDVTDTPMMVQVFTDKSYTYLILPPFICGILLIDESIKKPCLTRMKDRKHALTFLLIQQYIFAALYLIAWFAISGLFARTSGEQVILADMIFKFIRYFFSILIFTNLAELFKRLNIKALSTIPFVAAYVILILDVLAITAITGRQANIVYLLFSWTFHRSNILSIVMLGICFVITYILLRHLNRKADIY